MTTTNGVTAVIPLHPSHDRHLPALFENIASDAASLESIVIVRSETNKKTEIEVRDRIRALHDWYRPSDSLILVLGDQPQTAGQNKNTGWQLVSTPWTAFIDADDLYFPGRIALMHGLADRQGADVVMAGICSSTDAWADLTTWSVAEPNMRFVSDLRRATFPSGVRKREEEGHRSGDTNIVVPNAAYEPTQSHILIRSQLRQDYQFSSLRRGEDGQLSRDLVWDNRAVLYIDLPLTLYQAHHSTTRNTLYRRLRSSVRYRLNRMP